MPQQSSDPPGDAVLRQRALSRWESEGGTITAFDKAGAESALRAAIPEMTGAEFVALRVRMIALENLMIALLATATERQLELVREMAGFIYPRAGFTSHPLTIHAAEHMMDLVKRSSHFHPGTD